MILYYIAVNIIFMPVMSVWLPHFSLHRFQRQQKCGSGQSSGTSLASSQYGLITGNILAYLIWSAVYAPDLLGFGASAKPSELVYDPHLWFKQVVAFVEEVVQEPCVVVGNSIGSQVFDMLHSGQGSPAWNGDKQCLPPLLCHSRLVASLATSTAVHGSMTWADLFNI